MSVGGLSPSLLKVGEDIICSMTINPAVPIMPWFSWPSPLRPILLHQILCQLPPISLFSINQIICSISIHAEPPRNLIWQVQNETWANPNLADMLNIVVLDLVNQQKPKLTEKLLLRKSPLCSFWRLEKRRWEGVSHRPPVRSRPPMKEVSFRMLLGPSVSTITTFWWCEYSVPTTWSQHITLVIRASPQILPKPSPGSGRVY